MNHGRSMITISLAATFISAVFSQQIASAAHYDTQFDLTRQDITALNSNSLQIISTDAFVFNNQLNTIDWDNYFSLYAPSLAHKKEVILHWAGYASISPKLLLALIELQSELISEPDTEKLTSPLQGLSGKQGFDQQVEDVALQLSARFYAFEQMLTQQSTQRITSNTPATLALVSLLNQDNNHANKSAAEPHNQHTMSDLLSRYSVLFDGESLLIDPLKSQQPVNTSQAVEPAANFSISLPWPSGYAWYSGGAHSNTGSGYPYSSLDFNNGSGGWGSSTPWVQASHGGTVTRYSSCNIRVTHPNGYATSYYHMDSLQYNSGDVVPAGAWLGRYASNYSQALCEGGQSSGPHIHWSLLYNGRFVSLHNQYISGYRVDVGNSNYDDNCSSFYFEKNGYRTCAWRRLYH
ncbi:LasA protease [Pseudoalteromonas ulvae UL12]|uniref:M23 family metallopeptidase n=1 Tax=Pseudoalteromonas ulvae TaxID=107327 RepID=UPI0019E50041|nr:M23 family metallopeptidase [Pseudoalteromonas ulvae]MBE0362827.1 LasA protease [Pseudoalteromonas ulvae UL12]